MVMSFRNRSVPAQNRHDGLPAMLYLWHALIGPELMVVLSYNIKAPYAWIIASGAEGLYVRMKCKEIMSGTFKPTL